MPAFAREPGVGLIAGPDPIHKRASRERPRPFQSCSKRWPRPCSNAVDWGPERPGGNLRGVTNLAGLTLGPKQIEFPHRALANVSARGLLVNGTNPNAEAAINEAEKAAQALSWRTHIVHASSDSELETSFAALADQRIGALVVLSDVFFSSRRMQIVSLGARYRIPNSAGLCSQATS